MLFWFVFFVGEDLEVGLSARGTGTTIVWKELPNKTTSHINAAHQAKQPSDDTVKGVPTNNSSASASRKYVDLGNQFTRRKCRSMFRLMNFGKRSHTLTWEFDERESMSRSASLAALKEKENSPDKNAKKQSGKGVKGKKHVTKPGKDGSQKDASKLKDSNKDTQAQQVSQRCGCVRSLVAQRG